MDDELSDDQVVDVLTKWAQSDSLGETPGGVEAWLNENGGDLLCAGTDSGNRGAWFPNDSVIGVEGDMDLGSLQDMPGITDAGLQEIEEGSELTEPECEYLQRPWVESVWDDDPDGDHTVVSSKMTNSAGKNLWLVFTVYGGSWGEVDYAPVGAFPERAGAIGYLEANGSTNLGSDEQA